MSDGQRTTLKTTTRRCSSSDAHTTTLLRGGRLGAKVKKARDSRVVTCCGGQVGSAGHSNTALKHRRRSAREEGPLPAFRRQTQARQNKTGMIAICHTSETASSGKGERERERRIKRERRLLQVCVRERERERERGEQRASTVLVIGTSAAPLCGCGRPPACLPATEHTNSQEGVDRMRVGRTDGGAEGGRGQWAPFPM